MEAFDTVNQLQEKFGSKIGFADWYAAISDAALEFLQSRKKTLDRKPHLCHIQRFSIFRLPSASLSNARLEVKTGKEVFYIDGKIPSLLGIYINFTFSDPYQ
jgi:DNA primase